MRDQAHLANGISVDTPIGRRDAIVGAAAVLCAGAVATPAFALAGTRTIRTFKGRYAVDSNKVIDGFFAAPRRSGKFDFVIVVPGADGLDGASEALARRYATAGYHAIAPNLAPTRYNGFAGRDAILADLMAYVPHLKRTGRGIVKIVTV